MVSLAAVHSHREGCCCLIVVGSGSDGHPLLTTLCTAAWHLCCAACIADAKRHQKKLRPIKLLPSHSLEPLVKRYGKPAVQARYSDSTYACLLSPNEKLYTIMAALARGHPIACALV